MFPEGTSFLKLGLTYPLPMDLIRDFAKKVEKLYIIEELDPFMEDEIKAAGIDCVGKELTGKLYELNTELVRERVLGIKPAYKTVDEVKVAKRPPRPVSRLPPTAASSTPCPRTRTTWSPAISAATPWASRLR